MHDLDQTTLEWGNDMETFDGFQDHEFSWELHGMGDQDDEYGDSYEVGGIPESPFTESEEIDLASELLDVSNEEELNYFLGDLIKKAGKAVGRAVRSPVGQALGGVLKKVAKKALPLAGAAVGNLVAPGIGGVVGSKLASAAGSMFGLEVEGLSPEDRNFEVARRFVRLAGATASKAAQAPSHANPTAVAQKSLKSAARRHAPGVHAAVSTGSTSSLGSSSGGGFDSSSLSTHKTGRWIRRGNRIVVMGA